MAARKKAVAEVNPEDAFKPDYSNLLDSVERQFKLTASSMSLEARQSSYLSTGILGTDLMLGGGILPGAWYTFFGGEGSAKSTHVMHVLQGAVTTDVPIVAYFDFEGCTRLDTDFRVNGIDTSLKDLLPDELTSFPPEVPGFLDIQLAVDSIGETEVKARVFYGGLKTITEVHTEDGKTLGGYNHPLLVKVEDGRLAWKKIEELVVGDVLISTSA